MKKFYVTILTFILALSFNVVSANTINSIKMDIFVDDFGDAYVTEVWNCYAYENTEWYHTYKNIGNSKIIDFTVKDEDNINYTSLSDWNINGSFQDKKYKSGINKINNGVELCFGISEYYKNKTYTTNYTIKNFVSNLQDSQIIYWTLIDFSEEIGEVYIKIHSNFKYEDTYDVWGFGNYGGTAYVYDGYIEMQSPGDLEDSEYMTILCKFPTNTFKYASNNLKNDFNYYLSMAKEGSITYEEDTSAVAIAIVSLFVIAIPVIVTLSNADMNPAKILSTKESKKFKGYKEYYRDIPCNNDIFRAYYISYEYNFINNKTDLLGAILLKWLRDKKISIEKRETGLLKKSEDTCFVFIKDIILDNELERRLYDMMYRASKDGVLEKKEFEKWAKKNYEDTLGWFDDVINIERQKLTEEGILKLKDKKRNILAIGKEKYEFKNKTNFEEEAKKLKGLRNYLKDYTLIHERESIEVTLFEEYLMYAQIFGIAKTVIKEFKELYPDLITESSFKTYDNITYIHYTSHSSMKRAKEAYSRAHSYSSGGGGFSSGGGGGGSFGGGRRRLSLKNNMNFER